LQKRRSKGFFAWILLRTRKTHRRT
jgi:hypothetical protein